MITKKFDEISGLIFNFFDRSGVICFRIGVIIAAATNGALYRIRRTERLVRSLFLSCAFFLSPLSLDLGALLSLSHSIWAKRVVRVILHTCDATCNLDQEPTHTITNTTLVTSDTIYAYRASSCPIMRRRLRRSGSDVCLQTV